MKIQRLYIENLFGTFSYDIDFLLSKTLILTGANGYGKTTILSIIDNVYKGNLLYFYQLPFSKIQIYFETGESLLLETKYVEEESLEGLDEEVVLLKSLNIVFSDTNKIINQISIGESVLSSLRSDDSFHRGEYIDNLDEYCRVNYDRPWMFRSLQTKFQADNLFLFLETLNSQYIKAQRIYSYIVKGYKGDGLPQSGFEEFTIEKINTELKEYLEQSHQKYLQNSQQSDSRLFSSAMSDEDLTEEMYNQERDVLSQKIEELYKFNLIDKTVIPIYTFDKKNILSAYIKGIKEKISVYDDVVLRLRIFDKLLRTKEFINKTLMFDYSRGLVVRDINGAILDLKLLSLGEQNEIIILYNLVFKVKQNSLLLIDEPENSLHVAWQNIFIDELDEIAKLNNIQVVVATHSPQIIGGRWIDCYDLTEQNKNQ